MRIYNECTHYNRQYLNVPQLIDVQHFFFFFLPLVLDFILYVCFRLNSQTTFKSNCPNYLCLFLHCQVTLHISDLTEYTRFLRSLLNHKPTYLGLLYAITSFNSLTTYFSVFAFLSTWTVTLMF
jgi:hypothetical protein